LPQGPLWRKHAATEGTAQKRAKIRAGRRVRADPVPGLPGRRPKRRDERESCLEFDHFGLIALQGIDGFWPGFAKRRRLRRRARRNTICSRDANTRQAHDEGCEGFTGCAAEAGAARKSQAAEVAGARTQRGGGPVFRYRGCLPR